MAKAVKKSPPAKKATPAPAATFHDPFSAMRAEMDRMFEGFPRSGFLSPFFKGDFPSLGDAGKTIMAPQVDIKETDKAISIDAELPGLDEEDVSLNLSDGLLTLSGEKKYEKAGDDEHVHTVERSYGRFQRSFRLPETADEAKIKAEFDKGVLRVSIPKKASAAKAAKSISISSKPKPKTRAKSAPSAP